MPIRLKNPACVNEVDETSVVEDYSVALPDADSEISPATSTERHWTTSLKLATSPKTISLKLGSSIVLTTSE
jgi:hypothetical protein